MKPKPPTAGSGPQGACLHVRETLARCERLSPEVLGPDTLDSLAGHLETCDACRARHGTRLTRLQGLRALRERSEPAGTFDDFYAEVRERVPFAPIGGGMSRAFLDAPRSLRLWRSAALAASLLLAATAGIAFTQGGGGSDPGRAMRPLHDPRERLLQAFDTRPDVRSVRPVRDHARQGHASFFEEHGALEERSALEEHRADVVPVGHGAGWK